MVMLISEFLHVVLMRDFINRSVWSFVEQAKSCHKVTVGSVLICLNYVLKVTCECYAYRMLTTRLR